MVWNGRIAQARQPAGTLGAGGKSIALDSCSFDTPRMELNNYLVIISCRPTRLRVGARVSLPRSKSAASATQTLHNLLNGSGARELATSNKH